MNFLSLLVSLALATSTLWAQSQSATFVFISTDAAGEGFNDTTPRSEVESSLLGDNPGTTLGEIRQNVLTKAGDRWSELLLSNVPIRVEVDYEDFGGSSGGSITLAGALNTTVAQNFTNAPLPNTLYPIALANSLAGIDLSTQSDIEVSVNANAELNDTQTGSFTWYYGFDGNGPSGTVDFLDVISHELGHGLGFASNVSSTTGGYFGGSPNAFASLIYDASLELPWTQMTAAQRVTSSTSDPNLTWNGPNVTGAINGIESFVSQGSNISDDNTFAAIQAAFGGSIPATGTSGSLVLVDDGVGEELSNGVGSTADLVEEIQNGAEVSGNIALIARGLVNFDLKVVRAENAGAIAAVVYNNVDGDALLTPSGGTGENVPTIPMVFISENSGNELRALLTDDVVLTIFNNRVVVQTENPPPTITRLRLHAPATFETGSSISHWTNDSFPNLLMEPSINNNLTPDLDLSVLLMKDIGWNTQNIDIPYLTYDLWLAETGLDDEASNTAQDDDFDNDGLSNIEEYYHGTDPFTPQPPQLELVLEDGTLQHQRSTLSNDLILEYQRGETLTDFTTFSASETTSSLDEPFEDTEIDIDLNEVRQFFRLRIQALEGN
ncbi:MAG: PA domain-containing protein [Roseibacillus sp.]